MNAQLKEIRQKIAKLKREAEELRRLKMACETIKIFQKSIVDTKFD